ncbi:MAG: nitrophenyl compound nitroreductase subunit ArsF family protein [Bacteroidales bacterium]
MKEKFLTVLLFISFLVVSCKQQSQTAQKLQATAEVSGNDIEVYYFHMTVRCATCRTIESEARKNVEMLYPEEFNSGKINFTALNIEEEAGKALGDQFGIKGQTLLIVKGDQKINITNEGFLYAEGKPDKFASVIKESVDSLLLK